MDETKYLIGFYDELDERLDEEKVIVNESQMKLLRWLEENDWLRDNADFIVDTYSKNIPDLT